MPQFGSQFQQSFAQSMSAKRAALYLRVSTLDQHPETQLHDLRALAQQRGFSIVREYTDRISGTTAKRPGLDPSLSGVNSAFPFSEIAQQTVGKHQDPY